MLLSYRTYDMLKESCLVIMHQLATAIQRCYIYEGDCEGGTEGITLCQEHGRQLNEILEG